MTYTTEQFQTAARRVDADCQLVDVSRLEGGASAHVFRLRILTHDQCESSLVLRLCGERTMRQDADAFTREFSVLQELSALDTLPVPRPYVLDVSRTLFPYPWFLMEYVDADSPATTGVRAELLAEQLHAVHRTVLPEWVHSSLPAVQDLCATLRTADIPAPRSGFPLAAIRQALRDGSMQQGQDQSVLLHGDYWPGNILWKDGRIAAVIDWEDAATGDPLFDVANARLEILWAWGTKAMEDFTEWYVRAADQDVAMLPCWDLVATLKALRGLPLWGLEESREVLLFNQLQEFAEAALGRL